MFIKSLYIIRTGPIRKKYTIRSSSQFSYIFFFYHFCSLHCILSLVQPGKLEQASPLDKSIKHSSSDRTNPERDWEVKQAEQDEADAEFNLAWMEEENASMPPDEAYEEIP